MDLRTGALTRMGTAGNVRMPIRTDGARLPFYALMFFSFVLLVAPQGIFPALAPLHLAFVASMVAAAGHIADCLGRARPLTVMETEVRLVLLLFGLAVLSVPTSYWSGGSVQILMDLLGKSLIVFLLVGNLVTTVDRLRRLLWLLTLCSIVPALVVINNYLRGYFILPTEARPQGYLGVLTSNPNDVALTLNILLPLAVGLLLTSRRPGQRLALASIMAVGVAGIIVTFSRAGFIFVATTVLLYLKRLKRGRGWILLLLLLLLTLMAAVDGFTDRLLTILHPESESSARVRWETNKKALAIIAEHPIFGVGIGQNVLALNELGMRWTEIHNVYLAIAADLGIPGLIVYLLLLFSCIRSARGARRAGGAREVRHELFYLAQGLEVSLIGFTLASAFYPIAYHFFFYYVAGLAVAVKLLARRESAIAASEARLDERVTT